MALTFTRSPFLPQTLKKQAALVTAMKRVKTGSPKSEKHLMLNVASRYY